MIEALARIRNDSILSRPGKKAARRLGLLQRVMERLTSLPPRFYIGAILSALLVGIGVNALVLQRERHPAPLFAPAPQKIAAPVPSAPAPQKTAAPVPSAPTLPPAPAATAREAPPAVAPQPPDRPAAGDAPAPRAPDAIGELLRGGEAPPDNSRLVTAAQAALAKLGYPVKADGAQGAATEQAVREFERAHNLPVTTEITPRLVKQLNAAARASAH
jgi:hypothetical protein